VQDVGRFAAFAVHVEGDADVVGEERLLPFGVAISSYPCGESKRRLHLKRGLRFQERDDQERSEENECRRRFRGQLCVGARDVGGMAATGCCLVGRKSLQTDHSDA
jgi:hypothetical protein